MKRILAFACALALLTLPVGWASSAEEDGGKEPVWSAGTITEYIEGSLVTVSAPGEKEGELTSLTFTISEDTEIYGEIAVGMKIEIEHTEDQALYIQPAEEEGS